MLFLSFVFFIDTDAVVVQGIVDTLLELIYKEKKVAKKAINKPGHFQQVSYPLFCFALV